ncbi:MAG TPA: ABC transporter permease [Candidatus Acidoferrales bacterium]|nr:ABC transporter permease [Candidatus Acidoferrales bacterium]
MRSLRALLSRMAALFNRSARDRELARELESNLALHTEENLRSGLAPRDARREALLKLGGATAASQIYRERAGLPALESVLSDIRFAFRSLRKNPGFTCVAILSLALGIGANAAIFQVLDAVRLRSLPVPNPHQLARIEIRGGNRGFGITSDNFALSYPLFEQVRDNQQEFSSVLAWSQYVFEIREGAQKYRAEGLLASGSFFDTPQLAPAAGRLFAAADDSAGCASPLVVLSYGEWQRSFGGALSAIGSRYHIGDFAFEIVGVAPKDFSGPEVGRRFDFALPLCATQLFAGGPKNSPLLKRDHFWLAVIGRLKPGASFEQASAQLLAISPGIFGATSPSGYSAAGLDEYRAFRLEAVPAANGISALREKYDASLWVLLGMTGLVLLITCANLTNLMLARASSCQREFSVKLALGASRLRLARQISCESVLLGAAGAAIGILIAQPVSRLLVASIAAESSSLQLDLHADWRILGFASAIALIACVLSGLLPALRSSRAHPGDALKSSGRGNTSSRGGFSYQRVLVAAQVCVSFALVAGALLFVRSFQKMISFDPGFQEEGILLCQFDFSCVPHIDRSAMIPFERQLVDDFRAVPGVQAAGFTTHIFLDGSSWSFATRVGASRASSKFTWIGPGFFDTMRIPVIAGRDISVEDSESSPSVAIVNQAFLRRFFPSGDAIGKTFRHDAEPNYPEAEYQIVGAVADSKYSSVRAAIPPEVFVPYTQNPSPSPSASIFVRSSASLTSLGRSITQDLTRLHPGLEIEPHIFQEQIRAGFIEERLLAAVSGAFGSLAILLACLGLYGVVSYMVARRHREIGIRMALGASKSTVRWMISRESLSLVAVGLAIGVPIALAGGRVVASRLFGIRPADPVTLVAAIALLLSVTAVAAVIPAARASRQDPNVALRDE